MKILVLDAGLIAGAGLFAPANAQQIAAAQPAAPVAVPDCRALDVASLHAGSDFTPFLRADCPAEARNRGLARLWSMMPQDIPAEGQPF